MERGNLVYSTMNNTVTVPEMVRINHGTRGVDSSVTVGMHPRPLSIDTPSENVELVNPVSCPTDSSTENADQIPERPQDLIDKVSFGVAKVNFKSSAQYRKSYAFKIWREKGCFPFRLQDRPSSEDQKKSKRYLNAVKAQRDRHNEEEWRAYKSSKVKKVVTAAQRPSEVVEVVGNRRSEGHHQTLFTASKDAVTKRNPVHNNNIPCYFKAKKEISQKSQVTPAVTMAIPTSVIHVNTTKSCKNYQQIAHVRQESAHTTKEFRNQQFAKDNSLAATAAGGQVATMKERSSAIKESTPRIPPNTLVHWSGETTSKVSSKRLAQPPQIADGHSIAPTRTSIDGHSTDETPGCIKTSASEVRRLHGTHSSAEKISAKNHLHSTDKTGRFTHQHEKSDHLNAKDGGDREISGEKELASQTETLQKSAPDAALETNGHHLPTNNSNMVAIIKSTLNKKYCKENVKPGPERRKRRRENTAATDVGEPQRGRSAKQSKATVFTRLDETVATNLADGIHSVNSEYFPISTLANKAAKEASEKIVTSETSKMGIKNKVEEIDRAR